MKKKVFSLMMMLVLAFMGIARADELTVNDGTTTNGFVPVYGFYADAYLKCEFVQPAADLAAMNGGTINGMTFYASQESVSWGAANFKVFLTEVADASISAFAGPGTVVYEGALSISGGLMNVAFTTPYHYNGGNLLVGVYNTVTGSYVSSSWYGVSADGASVQGYSYSSLDAISPTQRNFLPKVTFDYTAGGGAVSGDITVHDGTATNSYVPVYGLYTDAYLKCEMVYPSAELAAMANTNISSMKFYLSSPATASWGAANFQVFMTEVADATISSFAGPGTVVYEGALDGTQAEMEITFTTPYHYNGGNLLVGVYNTATGTYKSCSFYGESVTGASVQGYSYSGLSSISPTQRNFLPKTTFAYSGGGGAAGDQLFALQNGEVVETIDFGSRPNGCWMQPFTFQLRNDGPSTTVSEIDFTPTDYFTIVAPELPVQMANGEVIDVEVTTGETNATAWQMVAIYGLGRTARVWDVVAEPYNPAIPDVVEKAYDFGTINNGFSYTGVPSQITPTVLHNDYTLPFPEIPEGNDAVYKFTVATDMILNANVDATAQNGKVALYTEDFFGEGGPMADNNYVGIQIGGGASGGSFQALIGDETSTTTSTYFPFHTLWNYSLGENLYLASELSEAGVTTAPMTSLSWYVNSTTCTTAQNGISIWMANVNDTELTSASHITSGMTLVYTGANILPVAGEWNEFVFNQGNFAWDGHSNVLVVCQRLNGSWQGSVSWKTHNPGFTAMCYDYDDYEIYDATTTSYSMTTSSTNRANVILKGGNRDRANVPVTFNLTDSYGDGWNGNYLNVTATDGTNESLTLTTGYTGSTTLNIAEGAHVTLTWTTGSYAYETSFEVVMNGTTIFDGDYLDLPFEFDIPGGGTPGPSMAGVSAGPVITNLPIAPGTYYLVASSTDADYTVNINAQNMPCPAIDAEGFAFNPTPADNEDGVEPASVTLRWNVPMYATGYRVIFGTTYYPDPNHPQTVMYPEDGSFTDHVLANSFTVRNLFNNTNYFWRVEFNNDACPQGVSSPVWGFTTHLNIPQNLTAVDYTVFDDEQIVLNWTSVVDRTFRRYFVYRDGVKVGETQANNIGNATYTDGPLAYNMGGYTYYVTAVYDEGESAPSDPVTVKVSGYGDVNGHVYEQDGTTGIAGATVTMVGLDEFNVSHTYNFTTNAQGYYSGHIYAGTYNGQAAKDGYQTITEPVQGNPIAMVYNTVTSPVDYVLDENFDPVCAVIAEYYPDSLDPNSPYVKVYWGCGLPGSEIVEPFETGDFSLFDWQLDPTYPWVIDSQHAYEGQYCMKSGNQQVLSSSSTMEVTVNIPSDGIMSFFGKISCESGWDYGYFFIDGVQKGSYTGESNWAEKIFDITAGDHTFTWTYEEDFMISSGDDCFYVDYITFYKQPEPPIPGMTYDFENSTMQGWTSLDADGDGFGWYVASEIMSTGYGHNGSNDCVLSQSYSNSYGALYPDNYLVSPQVELGGVLRFYACAQDANYAAEHFGVAVSTTSNNNPSAFTMLNEWTMSAKSAPVGRPVKNSRSGRAQGNWYEYTVDLSAYSGMGYVAIRHFNCTDMFYLDVDDITIGEPGKGVAETRSLSHYKIYRTDCYNDGPYTTDNTVLLATNWPGDTIYIDVEWADLLPGMYKWGVSCVYAGNRNEEIEGGINWSEPVNVNRATLTYDFDDSSLQGWTTIDANNDGYDWVLGSQIGGVYLVAGASLAGTGHNSSNDMMCSGSYSNYTSSAITPDNYLVSPQVALGGSISFWACGQDASYVAEHFGVAVSTTSNTSASAFTTIQEWTMTAKDAGNVKSIGRDGNTRVQGNWHEYSVDLSAYSGMGYVAIRHFNCNDQFILNVDDITIVEGAGGPGPGPGPNPGGNGLQEPRESEIVWSNCLDKDMYLTVADVNVLLNSADSPEGTVVTFTNYNAAEQQNYPIAPITLDESGFYAFDSFRRGAYRVTVEKEGYEPISDSINFIDYPNNLLTEMHLRYVMTEILYGVGEVYVSRTGWAMWDEANVPGGGGGGGQSGATTFSEDFENGFANWTLIDADGDGLNWYHSSQSMTYACYDYTGWGHNESNGFAVSSSYTDCTYDSFDPNNFLITNQKYSITSSSMLNFWADYGNDSYPDHFGVAVATVDNPTPADFTIVWEGNAKNGNAGKSQVRHNDDRYFNWRSHSVDLSAFAGQNVYIAFRHFNSYDQYEIYIDDVELTAGAKSDDRHFEYYKVMCTSIDGVPIYNHNTVYPFCQLTTVDPNSGLPMLLEGEHYLCKVAAMYSTGMSAWSEPVEWVYEPCDHWGPVDEVAVNTTNQGNHIEWVFEHGYNPYDPGTGPVPPAPGQGDWYYYDNGVNEDAIGTGGGNFWWGVMFPAGSYQGNMVTKVSAYDYMAMSGNVTIYVGGSSAPATAAGQTNVTFTGSEQFVEFEFADPVTIDPTQNVWVVFYNGSGATYPAAVCANTGDANGRWVSLDGAAWDDLAGFGLDYTFMVRAYIASGAKGNVKEVKVYEPQGNGGTLAISGNGPRVKSENVGIVMTSENTLEFSIADIANYDGRVYFLHKLYNDSRFSVINAEQSGKFIVSVNDNINLKETFADFVEQTMSSFARMDKYAAADYANQYKGTLPMGFVNSLMMDIYAKSRDNAHCADAYPFCTDNGMYEFPAGVNAGSGEAGPDYDCLYTTPNPAWYYMKMSDPGDMDIYMYSTPSVDIDFCCWGPFDDPISPCPNGLTEDKVVSCSYSAQPTEHCMIPASAQTGEYYILVITNYSNQACNINFSKVGGSGSTDCTIIPPAIVDVIGFLITQDGEYLAFVGPEVREYTDIDEFGDHEYCVRPIYPGEMVLPDHNYGWSMGCPVCANPGGGFTCEPGAPIHVENLYESDQIRVWWGEEPQPPMEEWLYYDDGTYASSIGTGSSATVYWAVMFPAASVAPYAGTNLTKVAVFEASSQNTQPITVSIYLGGATAPQTMVSTQTFSPVGGEAFHEVDLNTPVGIDGTQNLWIVCSETDAYPANGCANTGDANGRWISLDGVSYEDVTAYGLNYTWMIRGFVTNQAKGMVENIALDPMMPATVETSGLTLGHTEEVSIPADLSFMNRSSIVKYNVYRSTDNVNYALIGEVAEAGQTLYEYFDSPAPGTYYYQVKAMYDNGCESDPALAFDDPTHDYVIGICDGISENSDNVALYPNPTSGNVTIEANGMSRITVVSILGQVVFDTELNADTYTLNMAQFNAGLYMVRVYTEEGVTVKRVTVMQ